MSPENGIESARENGNQEELVTKQTEITKWLEREWLKKWLQLEPILASEDLRPYVFVAREKRLLASTAVQDDLETLISKLCGTKLEIRSAEQDVGELTAADAGVVFNGLREHILRAGSFKTEPQGIVGLTTVAKLHPHFQIELVALLEAFDPTDLGLWVVKGWNESITEPEAQERLTELLRRWVDQDDNKKLSSAAQLAISTLQFVTN